MPKAMIVLVILFVAVLGYLLFLGGRTLMGGSPPANTTEKKAEMSRKTGPDATDKALAQAQSLLDKTSGTIKQTASDAVDQLRGPPMQLSLAETPIVLEAGTPRDVKIRRANDAEMALLQLRFLPAAGSRLRVNGGCFEKGASETTFTVEALAGGLDASLTIEAGGACRIVVPVRVK